VLNSEGQLVYKALNKTDSSQRTVRIIIPRLLQLLNRIDKNAEWVVDDNEKRLYDQVNRICSKAGLPPVGIHGLRHSFASLAYHLGWKELSTMQMGGWSNSKIVHEIYTHNADLESDVQSMVSYYDDLDASRE
jgi:integrase